MQQYENHARDTDITVPPVPSDLQQKVVMLRQQVDRQDQQIRDLLADIRKLKRILDAHAQVINGINRDR